MLDNIRVNDQIVIKPAYEGHKFRIETVTKITATHIYAGNGVWGVGRIAQKDNRLMTPVEAQSYNNELDYRREQQRLAKIITGSYKDIVNLPVETLTDVARLLGIN